MKKVTIKELSEYCIISMSDEQKLFDTVGSNVDGNIVQAMADFIISHDCEWEF